MHVAPTPLAAYRESAVGAGLAYPALWIGAALAAARCGARLAWNAPGAPRPITGRLASEACRAVLAASDYVALRDTASRGFLPGAEKETVAIVPDTALDLPGLWDAASLEAEATLAFRRRGAERPPRWIAFHVNDRYLAGEAPEDVAVRIGRIAAAREALPVLLATGPCHGDDSLARRVGASLGERVLVVDAPRGLREVAALLAQADAYVGSSLHGLIVSLAYGRPGIAVADAGMVKFPGFLGPLGLAGALAPDWAGAEARMAALPSRLPPEVGAALAAGKDRIAAHWQRLRAVLAGPASPRAEAGRRAIMEGTIFRDPAGSGGWTEHLGPLQAAPREAATPPRPEPAPPAAALLCNICGHDEFAPAPGGRLTREGMAPVCTRCGSLERHRAYRQMFLKYRDPSLREATCLQFSNDLTVARGWFGRHELSVFGGPNSLDIQAIEREDAAYGVVVANHVLEHVPDHLAAMRELARVTRPDGFLFLSFPNPMHRATTDDWGYPKPEQHGHWRIFGRDIEDQFAAVFPRCHALAVVDRDPVTAVAELAYIVTASDRWFAAAFERGLKPRVVKVRTA